MHLSLMESKSYKEPTIICSNIIYSCEHFTSDMDSNWFIKWYFRITGERCTEIPAKACIAFPQKTTDNNSGTVTGFFVILFCVRIPCLSLGLTTTNLLVYAIRKTNRPINKRNVAVVIAVTIFFLISFVPYLLYIM